MFDHAGNTGLVWPQSIALRGMGMLSGGADADGHFSSSLECWPQGFEAARTRLAWADSLLRRHVQSDGSGTSPKPPGRSSALAREALGRQSQGITGQVWCPARSGVLRSLSPTSLLKS